MVPPQKGWHPKTVAFRKERLAAIIFHSPKFLPNAVFVKQHKAPLQQVVLALQIFEQMSPRLASERVRSQTSSTTESRKAAPGSTLKSESRISAKSTADTGSRPVFRAEWHDAKEIVVPFDASKFDVQLVNQVEWAAAYATKLRPAPALDNLRLETRRAIGKVVRTPGLLDDIAGFLSGVILFVEILLFILTAALLLSGFPISPSLAWTLVGAWVLVLGTFRFMMNQRLPYHCLVWLGSVATTLAWMAWSPWSHEVINQFRHYFFRT